MNVLIVDDEREIGNCIKNILELSHEVSVVDNPFEVKTMDPKKFDAIIVDMNMPGMNGLEVLAFVKEQNPQIKSILISGGDCPDSDLVDHFVQKPTSLFDLEDILSV